AVGEHLLLGGDNIDLALARAVEARLLPQGGQLDTQRFNGLVGQCRGAKERLLGDPTLAEVRLAVPGRGGAVIGGAPAASLEPEAVRARLCDVVASWHGGRRPAVLEGESLQLAVARGAAYFGLARRGLGVRIGGGAARTYYLGLGAGRALCLVPRGMEEGEQ